ncbi:hypothetical protein PEPS_05960 [Persicobacter psychrovividus]|uniref:Uncharacterized protein n=1 Tax=Persicobacter psychrovividus TaxID=387638 RepID=A0ABN6L5A5_9BACT|nr:hypothetical protein PEPS_05960 [Persicobacter psychrovividus]
MALFFAKQTATKRETRIQAYIIYTSSLKMKNTV